MHYPVDECENAATISIAPEFQNASAVMIGLPDVKLISLSSKETSSFFVSYNY